ncbi:MAG TPA: hypothetical protein VEH27_08700 [Methylomirabilota bacterium]|nr:hypothetical protein [Methylomirabilota bacterium]
MRTSSTSTSRSIDRDYAWRCLAVNLGLTPGLGSLMARRWIVGSLTLALAITGFLLFILGIVRAFSAAVNSPEPNAELRAHIGPIGRGFAIFIASWLISAIDSLLLVKNSPKPPPLPQPRVP